MKKLMIVVSLAIPHFAVAAPAVFNERGVHDTEDAVRFTVARIDLERLVGGGDRLIEAALPHVETGQLGRDVGRLRIELCGALECDDGAVDVVGGFQMPAQQELGVRFAAPFS